MAKRGREGMLKRAREKARQERQQAKRERRQAASANATEPADAPDEESLMEEFRVLSERHAAGGVTDDKYEEERRRIFVELGIYTEDDA